MQFPVSAVFHASSGAGAYFLFATFFAAGLVDFAAAFFAGGFTAAAFFVADLPTAFFAGVPSRPLGACLAAGFAGALAAGFAVFAGGAAFAAGFGAGAAATFGAGAAAVFAGAAGFEGTGIGGTGAWAAGLTAGAATVGFAGAAAGRGAGGGATGALAFGIGGGAGGFGRFAAASSASFRRRSASSCVICPRRTMYCTRSRALSIANDVSPAAAPMTSRMVAVIRLDASRLISCAFAAISATVSRMS
jgi:hypothetical protein